MYTIEVEEKKRNDLQKHLTEKGIMTKIYFEPVHLKTAYRKRFGFTEGMLPVTERLAKKVLTLPFHAEIDEKEMDLIADSIKSFFGEN